LKEHNDDDNYVYSSQKIIWSLLWYTWVCSQNAVVACASKQ